jgi:predicted metal-dependent hydrolase
MLAYYCYRNTHTISFCSRKNSRCKRFTKDVTKTLHPEVEVYADAAYTDYEIEDWLKEEKGILLKVQRKYNSKRPDTNEQTQLKLKTRKRIETTTSNIKKIFHRTIHAVTFQGFLLKLIYFICVKQLNHFLN